MLETSNVKDLHLNFTQMIGRAIAKLKQQKKAHFEAKSEH
jgi:hypothetical protein